MTTTFGFVMAWVIRQYGERCDADACAEIVARMMDQYNEDAEYWGGTELRRLADTVGADELARTLGEL